MKLLNVQFTSLGFIYITENQKGCNYTFVSSALRILHLLTHTIREAFYVSHHGPKHFISEFCNYMAFFMLFMYCSLSLFLTCSEIQKDVIVGDAV
jgi:hypothetical protein